MAWFEPEGPYKTHYEQFVGDAVWAWSVTPLAGSLARLAGTQNASGALIVLDFDHATVLRQLARAAGQGMPLIADCDWATTIPAVEMNEPAVARLDIRVADPFAVQAQVLVKLRERVLPALEQLAADEQALLAIAHAHEGHLASPPELVLLPGRRSENLAETLAWVRENGTCG